MKNKVSISMVSIFCLMLAGGAYEAQACVGADCPEGTGPTDTNTGGSNTNTTGGSNKSIAEGGYWSQVDALTANDKLMEIAYDDTLSDGKAKARDKAVSALNKALEAQKKLDDEVKARNEAIDNDKLTQRQRYESGMMTDDELKDFAKANNLMRTYCEGDGWCTAEAAIAGHNARVDYLRANGYPNMPYLTKEEEEMLRKYHDPETVEELKQIGKHPLRPKFSDIEEGGSVYDSLIDEYTETHGSEAERQQREQDFWDKMKADATEDAKKENASDIYNANKAMAEAMTPEMKETIRGELGVGDGAAINQALKDPKAKQDLQNRLDNMASTYSDFPKVDLDTQEGQSLLHSMVGTTNAGDLGTVKPGDTGPSFTVQTTEEKNKEEAEDAARDGLNNPTYNPGSGYNDIFNNTGDNTPGLGDETTVE